MFERFTNRSRRVIVLAQEEARLLKHDYIGTEHLLLGLLADGEGDAALTLQSVGVTLDGARREVKGILGEGHAQPTGHIPFTPRAKKVLELALREALTLRSQSIGSVHLLLGLISEGHGVGAQVIERLGTSLSTVKERAIEFAGREPDPASGVSGAATAGAEGAVASWSRPARLRIEGLGMVQDTLAIIERRLARIERHLGIAPDPADRDKPPRVPDPAKPDPAKPDAPDASDAPDTGSASPAAPDAPPAGSASPDAPGAGSASADAPDEPASGG